MDKIFSFGSAYSVIRAMQRLLKKGFWLRWAVMFFSCAGTLSGLVALLPQVKLDASRSLLMLLSCALASFAYSLHKTKIVHLPVDELAPPRLSKKPSLTLKCTTDRSHVAQVAKIARSMLATPAIPLDRYEQWLMINDNILVCLLDNSNQVLGYFDVYPLSEGFAAEFMKGHVGEQEIRREHILSAREATSCKRVYLAGFAVNDPESVEGKRHASILLWGLIKYIYDFYGVSSARTSSKQIFSIPVTPEGERLLQRFQFQLVRGAELRKEPFPVYSARLSSAWLNIVTANLPDWSSACRIDWECKSKSSSSSRTA